MIRKFFPLFDDFYKGAEERIFRITQGGHFVVVFFEVVPCPGA